MAHWIADWLYQPSHIALVISEVLALGLIPAKYAGIVRSTITFVGNLAGAIKK